jgi:pimeloyl-ACP methyl ester carboxylesterase
MADLNIRQGALTYSGLVEGPADGEPVILLHGFPETSRALSTQVAALAAAGYHVVAPDLRGFSEGARPREVAAYRLAEVTADVLGIAAASGATSFHLVGHDLGGIIAWAVAARHPEAVRTLTVASTPHLAAFGPAIRHDEEQRRRSPFGLFRQPDGVAEQLLLADGAAALRASYAGLDPAIVAYYVDFFSRPGVLTATLAHFRAIDYDEWAALPTAAMPTLFVWSTADPYLAASTAAATAQHVTGPYRVEVLEGVGHWIPELAAAEFSRLIRGHLAAYGVTSVPDLVTRRA